MKIRHAWIVFAAMTLRAEVNFNRDVRPIMSDTCFRCHGPDKSSRMAGLRLDLREEALQPTKSGVVPIVPGDPEKSAIIQRVFSPNAARLMPPKFAHKDLTEAQKNTLRQWVAEGATYEGHWAYQPVTLPELPAQSAHPVDAFIRAKLVREGLAPSPQADKRTLIRRVTLDLTGLPPTPQQVDAFLQDSSPDAYDRVVDRLLASPSYAEKQAMHWLDAVRYADTCGFHGDNPFPAWPYRDYVLKSFRDNKPFDQFTREQLAGDLLPNATDEQRVASAYNRLTRTSAEGGIQPKEYLAKYAADRVRTTSAVWLGSTMGCAECHDHKFDPFTAKDFYSFKAFFADIKEDGFVTDRGPEAWGVQLRLASPEQKAKLDDLTGRREAIRKQIEEQSANLTEGSLLQRYQSGDLTWKVQRPSRAKSERGTTLTIYNDEPVESTFDYRGSLYTEKHPGEGLVVASGKNPDNDAFTIRFKPGAGKWTAFGIEILQDESLSGLRFARGGDRFSLTGLTVESGGRKIPLGLATANTNNLSVLNDLPPMAAIDDNPKTGWGVSMWGITNIFLATRFGSPVTTSAGSVITVRMRFDAESRRAVIGRFRLALSSAEHSWPGRNTAGSRPANPKTDGLPDAVAKALPIAPAERSPEQQKAIRDYLAWSSPELQQVVIEEAKLDAELGLFDATIPRAMVSESTEPRETRILTRGNFLDESGAVVGPAIPAFLGKLSTEGRATRLDLANWLVSPENPLTARVFVNRTWRQFFGTGLSKQLDDLGSQGEWPVNQELLDWLAAEFQQAWDVRKLVRTIVTSETYKQSSLATPQMLERDPDNRLLARQSRFRVDAEIVHDVALATSGLLSEKFGGPSVRPYQPDGYLGALNYPKRDWSPSHGEDLHRRAIYTMWQRSYLHPSLLTFDAPTREECTVNRVNSNTPLQALVLMNDPIFVEAARMLAQNMMMSGGATLPSQVNWAFLRATGRAARPDEQQILAKLFQQSLAEFRSKPQAAKELLAIGETPRVPQLPARQLAAMTNVARAILNLHEVITRN